MDEKTSYAIADNCNVREVFVSPHHPLYCQDDLRFHEDNSLECEHVRVPYNYKTQQCLDYSMALLIIALARETL